MLEYTFLTIIAAIISIVLDLFILKTKLLTQQRYYIFIVFMLIGQTLVDNWLNGRWFWDSFIVGPYGQDFYLGIKILETPLENYVYGQALILQVVSVYTWLKNNYRHRRLN